MLAVLIGANYWLGLALWKEARSDVAPPLDSVRDFDLSDEPLVLVAAEDSSTLPVERGDLPQILARGTLRVILPTLEENRLPRTGALLSSLAKRDLAASFADRLGVRLVLVLVRNRDELLEALEKGYGDLVATELTIRDDRPEDVAFTHPTVTVDEWLVGRKGEGNLPRKMEDLAGREVHVLHDSWSKATLERQNAEKKLELNIVPVDGNLDVETVVYEVSKGERPLTVVDSHHLEAIESYNENIERLFKLSERRELGWAARKNNPDLLAAANQFIMAQFATAQRDQLSTGDLDAIKERGSLRVLTSNNLVNYFLYRGQEMGFDYEMALLAARQLGVRLEMVVPPTPELLAQWLLEGRGDVIAASFVETPERRKRLAFSLPYQFIDEMLVQPAGGEEKLEEISDLRGKRVHVRRTSSYYTTLTSLAKQVGDFEIVEAPEYLETSQLIGMVGEGRIPMTVADSHLLEAELSYRGNIEAAFPLNAKTAQKVVAFALRPGNVQLKAFFDRFVTDVYRSVEYNVADQRYFKSPRARSVEENPKPLSSDTLTPYDGLLKSTSRTYRVDWRLMAAQAFQESQFHADAQSWAGARGLFQLMPRTAQELGFRDVGRPEDNIHAGVKYMSQLISRFEVRIPLKQRIPFALAAYNAGWSHVRDARRLATQNGWDPDKWFGHTEKAMRLLEQPRYYRQARSGYCRGTETVAYVAQTQSRYVHYAALVPQ